MDSGVVQRPEWQRVHGVECSPVWRPENQDCRGRRSVPDLVHAEGRQSVPDLVHAEGRRSVPDLVHAGGRRSVPDGRASPHTHRGRRSCQTSYMQEQTVVPALVHARGRRSVPDLIHAGADGRASPRTRRGRRSCQPSYTQGADGQCQTLYMRGADGRCQPSYMQVEWAFNLPPRRALLRPHRLGWRPPTLKGLLLRWVQQFTCWSLPEPPQTQPEIMFNQLFMHLLASLIKLTCKINHHSHSTKYSAFFS